MSKARDLANFGDDISDGVISAERIPVIPSGTHEFVASGALDTGDLVVVNADGTVSVVSDTTTTLGSNTAFKSGTDIYATVIYDEGSQNYVIIYSDVEDGYYGKAVVATVSGTSVTFGSTVVFESANTGLISATYDKNAGKIVITYRSSANSYYGKAIVGTVSGTSISFGTPTLYTSTTVNWSQPVYDEASQKIVLPYMDAVYGSCKAIVGTVSGTSISFGAAVNFPTTAYVNSIGAAYDKTSQRTVVAYGLQYEAFGAATTITVSGTTPTIAAAQNFNTYTTQSVKAQYSEVDGCVYIAFRDGGSSNGGAIIQAKMAGTLLSFGAKYLPVVSDAIGMSFTISPNDTGFTIVTVYSVTYGTISNGVVNTMGSTANFQAGSVGCAVNTTGDKYLIAYANGNSAVFEYALSNLNASNFVGFSKDVYQDGETATVQIAGSVVNTQSGLEAGKKYYANSGNTLSPTPDSVGEAVAGTAISSTSLIVKG